MTLNTQAITPHLGAFVCGLDLSRQPDAALRDALEDAMARHLVLVIQDQDLSPAQLRDLALTFAPPHLHHADDNVHFADGLPEVLELRRDAEGGHLFGGGGWHADVTFQKPAGYFSFLHARVLPPVGGDTGFASTVAAFNALSPGMQAMLRGMSAVHSYDGPDRPEHKTLTVTHPVVRKHSMTGAEGLYLNTMFVTRFDGMTPEESQPLLLWLEAHMTRMEFTLRLRWQPGHLVIWDNRFTLHYPSNDFSGHPRRMIRCATLEPN
mgnify:CR=1 FL=1